MLTARFQTGLNDYEYTGTLFVEHPEMTPEEITSRLGVACDRSHKKGDPRQTPLGKSKEGASPSNFWSKRLEPKQDAGLDGFLEALVDQFEIRRQALKDIHGTGGRIECFVGVFANRLCDTVFPCELLSRLAN